MDKPTNKNKRAAPVVELLEPRMLFSADSLSALGSALLPDHVQQQHTLNDLYPELELPHPIEVDVNHVEETGVELVFIDARVPDLQTIVEDISTNKGSSVTVIVVDQSDSGIELVQATLTQHESVDAIHIVSHSLGSGVRLGSDFLTADSVTQNADRLAVWGNSLSSDADLLIYGCDIASSASGIALMEQLALITGADVAASSNDTGHARSNADWILEKSTGVIETASLVSSALENQWEHVLANWDPNFNVLTIDYTDDDRPIASSTRYTSVQALVEDANANSGGEISLREAITAANNDPQDITIKLTGDTYYIDIGDAPLTADENDSATGDLDIKAGKITIEGNAAGTTDIHANAVLNTKEMRVLDVHNDASLTLSDLKVSGGIVQNYGGGIRVINGALDLISVEIHKNQTVSTVIPGGEGSGGGGGIYSVFSEFSATDTHFTENTTPLHGGGLHLSVDVPADKETASLIDSSFTDNAAFSAVTETGSGGGLYVDANINITNTGFDVNHSANGGAAHISYNSKATINGSTIDQNTGTDGAGIYVKGTLHIGEQSIVSNNIATHDGGGIYISNATATMTSVTIEGNTADADGGGIHMEPSSVDIYDSIFEDNHAVDGFGGAINASGETTINESTFTKNSAKNGGAVAYYNVGVDSETNNSTFYDNEAMEYGGAIRVQSGTIDIYNATIAANQAGLNNGAINASVLEGGRAVLRNTIISNNTSNHVGDDFSQLSQNVSAFYPDGTISNGNGFNVITDGLLEQHYVHSHTDISEKNMSGYTVNAMLDTDLSSSNDSHSTHLQLQPYSDAIDAGGNNIVDTDSDGTRTDGYGISSNAFMDAGAVEYQTDESSKKLFWIDRDSSGGEQAIYRMNEDGRARQQIVAPLNEPSTNFDHEYLDVAYDPQTQQLFYIDHYESDNGLVTDNYHVVIANIDGVAGTNMHLATGGVAAGGTQSPGQSFKTTALDVEISLDPNPLAPNKLYLAQHAASDDTFRVISFDIVTGEDTASGTPNIWLPATDNSFADVTPTPVTGTYTFEKVTSLDVVSIPDADADGNPERYISVGDSGLDVLSPNFGFVVSLNEKFAHSINVMDPTGNVVLNGFYVNGIVYEPSTNTIIATANNVITPILADNPAFSFNLGTLEPPVRFSDIDLVYGDDEFWIIDSAGKVYQLGTDMQIIDQSVQVAQQPYKLALASFIPVNTPPRLATATTLSMLTSEGSPELLTETMLGYVDGPAGSETLPENIYYTLTELPEHGTLTKGGDVLVIDTIDPAPAFGHFTQLDINTGEITYIHDNGEDSTDAFSYLVSDKQPGGADKAGSLSITITNVNDNPEITLLNPDFTVAENTVDPQNLVLGTVQVTDPDNALTHVEILANPYVELVGNDIKPITDAVFDHEAMSSFTITIRASDVDGGTSSVDQIIAVTDVNETPEFPVTTTNAVELDENSVEDTIVIDTATGVAMLPILSTDPDSATVTYSLTDELGNTPTLFKLSADNRIVATGTPTDYEDTNAFVLTVSVTDGDLIATHDINVAILPVNETPIITTPVTQTVELDENSVEDTIVIDTATGVAMLPILSTDPDSATLTYSLTDELGNTPTLFKLSADNRIVATGTPTDYEDTNGFVLTVSVSDGALIATHDISVAILPVNESPVITTPVTQTAQINENSLEDTIVIDTATGVAMLPILSTDPDSANLTYSLTDELGNTPTLFKLSADNRIVATGTPTDYEDTNAFVLTVSVSDGALIATHDINVAILPVNESPVITTPVTQTAQINENSLEGHHRHRYSNRCGDAAHTQHRP